VKEEELYRLKSFLLRSETRKKILVALSDSDEPLRPTDLSEKLGIQRQNVSARITDLSEEELVKLLNPDDNRNRFYKITEKGQEVLESLD
jgi:DNA-binding MarR family transcriptional regulator